jgi:hypothetical protein
MLFMMHSNTIAGCKNSIARLTQLQTILQSNVIHLLRRYVTYQHGAASCNSRYSPRTLLLLLLLLRCRCPSPCQPLVRAGPSCWMWCTRETWRAPTPPLGARVVLAFRGVLWDRLFGVCSPGEGAEETNSIVRSVSILVTWRAPLVLAAPSPARVGSMLEFLWCAVYVCLGDGCGLPGRPGGHQQVHGVSHVRLAFHWGAVRQAGCMVFVGGGLEKTKRLLLSTVRWASN